MWSYVLPSITSSTLLFVCLVFSHRHRSVVCVDVVLCLLRMKIAWFCNMNHIDEIPPIQWINPLNVFCSEHRDGANTIANILRWCAIRKHVLLVTHTSSENWISPKVNACYLAYNTHTHTQHLSLSPSLLIQKHAFLSNFNVMHVGCHLLPVFRQMHSFIHSILLLRPFMCARNAISS